MFVKRKKSKICRVFKKENKQHQNFKAPVPSNESALLCTHRNGNKQLVYIFPQDTLGGGFDATQAYVGELANLNIWNRKLSLAEIYNLATCNSKAPSGNVFSWMESNIEIFGGATKWTFEPCRSLN